MVAIVIRAEDVAPDAAEYVTFLAKPLPAPKGCEVLKGCIP
ncbi:unnamed protein product [Ciceribacter sp. T2.26MG-112.2]|nr:unnamed protein product [Ciceribacter naphthalenivorans]